MNDRLTGRTDKEVTKLRATRAAELTFNELLAVAGGYLAPMQQAAHVHQNQDAGRDVALAFTALEDALMRHNSACYRIAGTWKRADPELPRG